MSYTTAEVATAARTSLRAVRIWEAKGLFGNVTRDKRGDRRFTPMQVERAKVISAATMAGMGLDEIKIAHPATLLSAIGGARVFLKQVYAQMDKDFDL